MVNDNTHERILILDFGSQVTQLIARRVREAGVYCEIYPFAAPVHKIRNFAPKGIILSGGPASVHAGESPKIGTEFSGWACRCSVSVMVNSSSAMCWVAVSFQATRASSAVQRLTW